LLLQVRSGKKLDALQEMTTSSLLTRVPVFLWNKIFHPVEIVATLVFIY
jgi:hypothetical protein